MPRYQEKSNKAYKKKFEHKQNNPTENQREGKAKEGNIQDMWATLEGTARAQWRVPE